MRSQFKKQKMFLKATAVFAGVLLAWVSFAQAQEVKVGRENIRMSVVAVNPSATVTKTIPIRVNLPVEVTPGSIVNTAGLAVEYDTETSTYYLYKEGLELAPKETRTFEVEVQDVWVVSQDRIDALRTQASFVIENLKGTEYYESAQKLGESIDKALDTIMRTQNDDTVSNRSHIGVYRNNLKIVDQIKDDIENLEKQMPQRGAPPVPEVLENSQVKANSPTKTTTWMIILIIMVFVGILAGVFFFTWQTQAHFTKDSLSEARKASFPGKDAKSPQDEKDSEGGGDKPKTG